MRLKGLFLLLLPLSLTAQSIEGTSYFLPKNGARFTVKVEKTQYTPGRLCQYAERYLKQAMPQKASTTYRIIGIDIDPTVVPDTRKRFEIRMEKKRTITRISTSADGRLLAINAQAKEEPVEERSFTPAPKPAPLNPADYMTSDILNAGSKAKMAELTANEIYDIRDSRNQLSRGDADNMPKDGAQLKLMYENMNRQEEALTQLFAGTTVKDTTWTTISLMPEKEGRSVLFRFSKYFGLVDANDLSGEPYYVAIADLHTVVEKQLTEDEKKKEDKDDIGLRVNRPSKIRISLTHDGKTLKEMEMNAGQFGFVESLSGDLFGKKQTSQIIFDPMTGSVKQIKAVSLEK